MKASNKILIAVAFSLVNVLAYSQANPNNRIAQGWVISKDVQRFSNKDLLTRKTGLDIKSVDQPAYVISKGVQTVGRYGDAKKGNVVSHGYPTWIISKGVQKIGRIN
ncbi:MAG: hypothetical protein DI538_10950 [Azospira oryzae]|nr:MAG: hypothetical protein DI538_10950 [Azospira oryzae]